MPWAILKTDKACNRCRATLPKDAEAYQGDVTGAWWCAACAGDIAGDGDTRAAVPASMADLSAAFRKVLEQRAERDVSARIVGSE